MGYRIHDRVAFLLRTKLIAKLYLTVYFKHISPNSIQFMLGYIYMNYSVSDLTSLFV